MHDRATTAYLRTRFEVEDPGRQPYDELRVLMRYDDGFVAYLNGTRIAAANAPAEPDWHSAATADHPDQAAMDFVAFPFEPAGAPLRKGVNILAVHGMDGQASSDFLITPEIEGVRYTGADPIALARGVTTLRARSFKDGKWSPIAEVRFEVKK